MQNQYTKTKIITSLIWKIAERGATQGIQFIVQVLLARLLLPEDFGTIAIVSVFISLGQVFVQSGLNTALIQKKDADLEDFSSVLYLSLFIAGLIYLLVYFTSPYIASYYEEPVLVPALRILSITLIFGAFNSIQNAYIARNMMFKQLFYSSLGAVIISGIGGIISAYADLGVWALVIQQLLYNISIAFIMWFTVRWRPILSFSLSKVKNLFSFGWKLLVSSLLNNLYIDLRTLIVGRLYSSSMLGFYNRGELFSKVIVLNIDSSIQSVMLPTLSAHQDDRNRVKEIMRRAILTSSFFVFPMMIGMSVVAEPLVKIILTEKWLPAVPFLQIFCISYMLIPIHTSNLQAINAMGRSDIFLKLESIKKIIGLIILGISLPLGVYAIAIAQVLSGIISTFINAYPNKQLLDYSYKEQLLDTMPSFIIAIIMGSVVYTLKFINLSAWKTLVLQVIIGALIYIGLAKVLEIESLSYIVAVFKELWEKIKEK